MRNTLEGTTRTWAHVLANPVRQFRLLEFPGSECDHRRDDIRILGDEVESVQPQEHRHHPIQPPRFFRQHAREVKPSRFGLAMEKWGE